MTYTDAFAILIRGVDKVTSILFRWADIAAQVGELWGGELEPWGWREIVE